MLLNRKSKFYINEKIYDRNVLYSKNYKNISLKIFEGTHEMIDKYVEQLILPKKLK
jgi:hypothetical protein